MIAIAANAAARDNRVVNPTFDSGVSGWQIVTTGSGALMWDGGFGNPAGAAYASSPAPNSSASLYQCIAISAPNTVDFIVDAYVSTTSVSGGYVTAAFAYSQLGCVGTMLGNLPAGTESFPTAGWHGLRLTLTDAPLPDGTKSVYIRVGSIAFGDAGSVDNYYFDNIRFGTHSIFSDGFEP